MKKIFETRNAPAPIGPYNQAVEFNNTLYVSGQIPMNPSTGELELGDIEHETHLVMKNIQGILTEAGLGFQNILKASIFLSDMNNFSKMNAVYGSYFKDQFPARECVQVSVLPKNVNVEISVIVGRFN